MGALICLSFFAGLGWGLTDNEGVLYAMVVGGLLLFLGLPLLQLLALGFTLFILAVGWSGQSIPRIQFGQLGRIAIGSTVGTLPLPANEITYSQPSRPGRSFAQQRLETWLDEIAWPYQPIPEAGADGV